MTRVADQFFEHGTRLLTSRAFEFVLDGELKRAVRSQNFLTLVVLETSREWDGMTMAADEGTVAEVAEIVGHEVRDTDLLGYADDRMLALVLLDANYENSTTVIDRIVHRKEMRAELSRLLEYFWRSTRGFARDGQPSPHAFAAAPASP